MFPSSLFSRIFLSLLLTSLAFTSSAADGGASAPSRIGNGYRLVSIRESSDGGLVGILQVKQKNHIYGADIPLLQLSVKHETGSRLRVHITDAAKQRWEVPYNLLPREKPPPLKQTALRSGSDGAGLTPLEYVGSELIFAYDADPFGFTVRRKSNGQILFVSPFRRCSVAVVAAAQLLCCRPTMLITIALPLPSLRPCSPPSSSSPPPHPPSAVGFLERERKEKREK